MSKDNEIAEALGAVAEAVILLGNNRAIRGGTGIPTYVGGLEGLGETILTAGEKISEGLHDLAAAIRETQPNR